VASQRFRCRSYPHHRVDLSSSATGSLCKSDGHIEAEVQCAIRLVEWCCGSRKRFTALKNPQRCCQDQGTFTGGVIWGDRMGARSWKWKGKNEFGISQLLIFGLWFSFSTKRLAFEPWPALPLSTLSFHCDVVGAFLLSRRHRRGRLFFSLVPTAM